jgi:hypothetical protein
MSLFTHTYPNLSLHISLLSTSPPTHSSSCTHPPAQMTTNHIFDFCLVHPAAQFDPAPRSEGGHGDVHERSGLARLWVFLRNRFACVRRDFVFQVRNGMRRGREGGRWDR